MNKPAFHEQALTAPDLQDINEEFLDSIDRRDNSVFARQRTNYRARYCIWPGQTPDGRRWNPSGGEEEVFPWPGAADTRVHLIDGFINEDVALLKTAWRRNRITVSGTEINDRAFANRLTDVLKWMKYTQMRELKDETSLMANWLLERGAVVAHIVWDRQRQLGHDTLDMENIIAKAMDAQQRLLAGEDDPDLEVLARFPQMVMDESQDDQSAELFLSYYPDVRPKRVPSILKSLRETGVARFPRPYIQKDRPSVVALQPNEDVFLPQDAVDIESSRAIYRRELISETTLKDRINTHGWDDKFVGRILETQRGRLTPLTEVSTRRAQEGFGTGSSRYGTTLQDPRKLYEVVHAYRRMHDEDGVPGIYLTVYSPGMVKHSRMKSDRHLYGIHQLLNYDHGQYPFKLHRREMRSRVVDDSRGYGEVGITWQDAVKGEVDSRRDRTSIVNVPPLIHPIGRAPDRWGPGTKVGASSPNHYKFADVPRYDVGSKEIEETMRLLAARYFGRQVDDMNAIQAQVMQQCMVDDWLEFHADVDTQVLQLMQQFMPENFYYRVVGSNKGQTIRTTREEIQGQFDVSITYDTTSLNPERVEQMFNWFDRVLSYDVGGRVDRDEVVQVGFDVISPNLGERVMKPGEESAVEEVENERQVISQMANGIGVDIKPGQAYHLRMQTLQETISKSPKLMKLYQEDEQFRDLVDKRVQMFQHQIDQRTVNPQAGRLGALPSNT